MLDSLSNQLACLFATVHPGGGRHFGTNFRRGCEHHYQRAHHLPHRHNDQQPAQHYSIRIQHNTANSCREMHRARWKELQIA